MHRIAIDLRGRCCFDSGGALKHNDTICEISCHDEIVLDDKGCAFCVKHKTFDDLGGNNTLLRIKER